MIWIILAKNSPTVLAGGDADAIPYRTSATAHFPVEFQDISSTHHTFMQCDTA
jgi:hypothetical protein